MSIPSALDTGFGLLWRCSWQAGIIVVFILICRQLFQKWISPKARAALWLLVVARLVFPLTPASAWSVFNLFGTQLQFSWKQLMPGLVLKKQGEFLVRQGN